MERKLVRKEAEGRKEEETSIDQVLQSTGQGREGGRRALAVSARQGRKRLMSSKAHLMEESPMKTANVSMFDNTLPRFEEAHKSLTTAAPKVRKVAKEGTEQAQPQKQLRGQEQAQAQTKSTTKNVLKTTIKANKVQKITKKSTTDTPAKATRKPGSRTTAKSAPRSYQKPKSRKPMSPEELYRRMHRYDHLPPLSPIHRAK